jgi:hypothetical protein
MRIDGTIGCIFCLVVMFIGIVALKWYGLASGAGIGAILIGLNEVCVAIREKK